MIQDRTPAPLKLEGKLKKKKIKVTKILLCLATQLLYLKF